LWGRRISNCCRNDSNRTSYLVIIDSDSSLIPKSVLDGDVGDSAIGKKARLNSSAYPKIKSLADRYNVCVVVVSQYREKIGVMFGNPTTTQGGHALKFYSDVRIEVSKTLAKEGDVTYGNITKVKAIKNKMSPPYKQISFEIVYGVGIDRFQEIIDLADELELGRKYGQTYTFDGVKYQLDEFKQRLMEECDFFDEVKATIIKKIKNTEEDDAFVEEETNNLEETGKLF
jgi:recombination protein RecA